MAKIEDFKIGMRFAVTRSKHTGDRSYIHTVWEIIEQNEIDIKAKPLDGKALSWSDKKFVIFSKDEYDFYEVGDSLTY